MPRESKESKRERAAEICERLLGEYPDATTALNWSTPWDLLVATILSAQCTDEKVNEVTEELFEKYETIEDYAEADQEELEQDIRPTGTFRKKAQRLIESAQMILDEYDGEVPRTIEEMTELRGVARKTANVVLGTAWGITEGIFVDTHVARLSLRMGLTPQQKTKTTNTDKIERDLMELLPEDTWVNFAHAMVWHGREVCTARTAHCDDCVVEDLCPKRGVD